MKNVSLIINIILLLAVAFLYFYTFGNKNANKPIAAKAVIKDSAGNITSTGGVIAYVELDSLNSKITYIKSRREELEREQKAIENEWNSGMRNLEARRDKFVQRGNAITQAEAEKFQEELMAGQQTIEQKKQNSSNKLQEKSYRYMEDIQGKLKNFLADYNKEKGYTYILTAGTGLDYMIYRDSTLNITNDVISGMNAQLKK
jgi:outer membrane protein